MIGDVVEVRSRRLGLQRGNSVGRAVFLSKGQACCGVLPNEDLLRNVLKYTRATSQYVGLIAFTSGWNISLDRGSLT